MDFVGIKRVLPLLRGFCLPPLIPNNQEQQTAKYYPELGLLFIDLMAIFDKFNDNTWMLVIEFLNNHEFWHLQDYDVGTILNMVRINEVGNLNALLAEKIDSKILRRDLIIREIANNKLFVLSKPLIEAQSIFLIDIEELICSNADSVKNTRFSEDYTILLKTAKQALLEDNETKNIYQELLQIIEKLDFKKDLNYWILPVSILRLALDIPFPLNLMSIFLVGELDPTINPKLRLEMILDICNKMEKNKPGWIIHTFLPYLNKEVRLEEHLKKTFGLITPYEYSKYNYRHNLIINYSPTFRFIGYEKIKSSKNWLDEIIEKFEQSEGKWPQDLVLKRFLFRMIMHFACVGFPGSQKEAIVLIPNPLYERTKLLDYWILNWYRTCMKHCMIYGEDMESLFLHYGGIQWNALEDIRKSKGMISKISNERCESWIEDLFDLSCNQTYRRQV